MLAAGELKDFAPLDTERFMNKFKAGTGERSRGSCQEEMFQGVSIWRRTFAIFAAYFNLHFTLFTVLFPSVLRDAIVLQWVSLLMSCRSSASCLI
ncbi:hypothetical protein MTO96_034222 [Rhipicephalus appendiculatus]